MNVTVRVLDNYNAAIEWDNPSEGFGYLIIKYDPDEDEYKIKAERLKFSSVLRIIDALPAEERAKLDI
jgi:hypothetical protein